MSATPVAYERETVAAAPPSARALSWRWIVSAREDLAWFFAPALACYALIALYAGGARLAPLLLTGVFVLLDTPHVFATYTRTYFDREERQGRRRLLAGALLLFLLGPAAVLLGQGARFFVFAGFWAYYHQAKQHYGFAVIYKIKNRDLAPVDNALDRLLLAAGFAYPLVAFVARNTNALARVPAAVRPYAAYAPAVLLVFAFAVACVWLARQVQKWARGEPLDAPKLLLFAAAIPPYWLIALGGSVRDIAYFVLLTSPLHTLPYQRLVWFHNRRKYAAEGASERHGAAALMSTRLIYYAASVVALSLCYHALRNALFAAGGHARLWTELALSFILGHLLVHFYLDSKIWRVRRDPSVGKALRMD